MKTVLYDQHVALGARIVDFAGWDMPVQYTGILEEHKACRTATGIFDVSHMGELWVTGDGAFDYLQHSVTHDLRRLLDGKWAYSPVCRVDGGTVDDIIVYPREGGYLVCVNASNADKDYAWFKDNAPSNVVVENHSSRYAQIAVQGPEYKSIMDKIQLPEGAFRAFTGYTGEKGCEIYLPPEHAVKLWCDLVELGAVPCGLGARDSLRLEAALPLYGHELSDSISPYEAGLHRFICFDKGDFVGRDALLAQKNDPKTRKLVGLRPEGRAIARAEYPVCKDGAEVGVTTSGGVSPTLGGSIAMALITGDTSEGEGYSITVRGKSEPVKLVELPFYKRAL